MFEVLISDLFPNLKLVGNQGGGAGGLRALAPHLLGIYLINFGNFSKIRFSLFTVAPHKKFASAHPARINYYELITKN